MTQIKNLWVSEDSLELLAQTGLHLFLIDEDAVFGQAPGLYISVEQDDSMTRLGEFPGSVDPGWSGADHKN
jgi:hypothetical protein